jgi:hypothetical protein
MPGTFDCFISGNWLKNAVGSSRSMRTSGQLRQIDHSEQAFQGGRNFSERLLGPDRDELARKFGFRHLRFHYGYSIGSLDHRRVRCVGANVFRPG